MGSLEKRTGQRSRIAALTAAGVLAVTLAAMGQVSVPHVFEPKTKASASEVNDNFTVLAQAINDNLDQIVSALDLLEVRITTLEDGADGTKSGTPAGAVMAFAGRSVPSGWLLCDGSAYDVEDPLYAELFAAIGTTHGGDGIVEFRVPDYRGTFLRGVDHGAGNDPDVSGRSILDPTEIDPDSVGTTQGQATARPATSAFVTNNAGNHSHTALSAGSHSHDVGTFTNGFGSQASFGGLGPTKTFKTSTNGAHTHPTDTRGDHSHTVVAGGDAETRPRNAYVDFIIKL